jgi:hypothetical protein
VNDGEQPPQLSWEQPGCGTSITPALTTRAACCFGACAHTTNTGGNNYPLRGNKATTWEVRDLYAILHAATHSLLRAYQ